MTNWSMFHGQDHLVPLNFIRQTIYIKLHNELNHSRRQYLTYRRVFKRASGTALVPGDGHVTSDDLPEGASSYFLSGVSDHQAMGPLRDEQAENRCDQV